MDPQAYAVLQNLLALRRAFLVDPDTAVSVVALATEPDQPKRSCGPATALSLCLPRLGLSLSADACLKGPDNSRLHLDRCRRKSLRDLVQRAWAFQVAANVCHRNGLRQIEPPLPEETGKLFRKLSPNEQLIIARHVAGSFGSAAAKHKWDEDIPEECPLCGSKQTKVHKILHCPALEEIRRPHAAFLTYVMENWPHWCHGPFAVCPPHTEVSRLIFHSRRLPPPLPLPPELELPGPRGFLRMFTDGSCAHPTLPLASRASFAVIVDTTTSDNEVPAWLHQWRSRGVIPPCFRVHCLGLVPGEQNIHRAELCGILQAVRVANAANCPAEVWTDSQVALNEWDRIQQGLPALWPDISCYFLDLRLATVRVKKIAAHRDLMSLWGMEQWCAAGNDVADTAAKSSLSQEYDLVQNQTDETAEWQRAQRDALWVFWRLLLALSKEEVRLLNLHRRETQESEVVAPAAPRTSDTGCALRQATALRAWKDQQLGPWSRLAAPCGPQRSPSGLLVATVVYLCHLGLGPAAGMGDARPRGTHEDWCHQFGVAGMFRRRDGSCPPPVTGTGWSADGSAEEIHGTALPTRPYTIPGLRCATDGAALRPLHLATAPSQVFLTTSSGTP